MKQRTTLDLTEGPVFRAITVVHSEVPFYHYRRRMTVKEAGAFSL